MDYDGANQRQVTHQNSISLSPRISPDGSRLAFSSITKSGWEILMYSMDLNRLVSFHQIWRKQFLASVVRRRHQAGVFFVALWRS